MLDEEYENTQELEETTNVIEIDDDSDLTSTLYDINPDTIKDEEIDIKPKKEKKKFKLTKNQKITIIVLLSILFVLIVGLIIYFFVIKKDKKDIKTNEPLVLIEKDNYTYQDGKLIFKDEEKKEIGSYKCKNENADYCYVAYYSDEDTFDIDKHVYENGNNVLHRSDILDNTYVFVYDNNTKENGTIDLYDIKEEKVIETYKLVKELKDNKVIVKKSDDTYNIIDSSNDNKEVLKTNYDYIGYIKDSDKIVVSSNNNYMLLDMEGKEVSKSVPGIIKNFDNDSISVDISKKIYAYDYQGNKKIETGYDYIKYVDSYIIALDGKKMYVYDKEGSIMNIDAIKINNTNYNTKLVFNDELRQTGKEMAFEAFISDGALKVQVDDENTTTLNLYEGLLNKKLDKISYYNGKLYFYSNKEKTDLIGTYPCTNKNVVDKDSTYLSNCYIAEENNIINNSDKTSYMPIYNKTFAFITDHDSNPNSGNVIVWNLKTNKKVVSYLAVDANYHKSESGATYIDTAGTILIAKNSNESYGVVNIGTSNINGLIPFSDEAKSYKNVDVKYIGKDILFKRNDGTYHLYDIKGNEITKNVSTKYEIISYNSKYLLVKNNDKYLIYSLSGNIVSDEFKYLAMENTYYIGVDNNSRLGVFTYDSKRNLINENISLGDVNYAENIKYTINGNIIRITYNHLGEDKTIDVSLG